MSKTARDVICASLPRSQDDFIADDIIRDLDAAGFVIVPKEPTPAMLKAADSIWGGGFQNSRSDREIYEVMIETAAKSED